MRTSLLFSLFFITTVTLLHAEPQIIEVRDFDPPVAWQTDSSLSGEAWWKPLLVILAPYTFTYEEWAKYHSEAMRAKLDKEAFHKAVEQFSGQVHENTFNGISRLIFIRDGDDTYLEVVLIDTKAGDPASKSSNWRKRNFLKKHSDGWIHWTLPTDMSFKSELIKIGDSIPLPDSGK